MILPPLELGVCNGRFFLEPPACPQSLVDLAARCTRSFAPFSQPLKKSQLARFRAADLTATQRINLETWGNPYVFNQFRFRYRLSSRLSNRQEQETLYSSLYGYFGAVCAEPATVDSLCLFVEADVGSPMRLLYRFPFCSPHLTKRGEPAAADPFPPKYLYSRCQRGSA